MNTCITLFRVAFGCLRHTTQLARALIQRVINTPLSVVGNSKKHTPDYAYEATSNLSHALISRNIFAKWPSLYSCNVWNNCSWRLRSKMEIHMTPLKKSMNCFA